MAKILPKQYRQLEYITSENMGSYIQLNYGFDATDEIEIKTKLGNTNQDRYLVAPTTWNSNNNRFAMGGTNVSRCVGFGQQTTNYTLYSPRITPEVGQITTETYSNRLFTLTGESINSTINVSSTVFDSETDNLKLFYGYNATTQGSIYYWKHKKLVNGVLTLVEDLVPAKRISDSVIGMYDLISKQFFTNSGTGTFTAGPIIDVDVDAYDELEYIQSTGTQRIDLNISGNARAIIDAQCESDAHVLLSSTVGASAGSWIGSYSNKDYWTVGSSIFFTIPKTTRSVIDATFSSSGVTATIGSETKTNTQTVTQDDWTLFACGSMGLTFTGKVWSCKMYQNDALVRNLIPVRRYSDSAIGMVDTLTDTFYANAGTGTFIPGPSVNSKIYTIKKSYYKQPSRLPSGYTELEYLQSSGTQYIDTGINAQNVNKYNVTFELINNTSPFIIGGRNKTAPNYNRNYLSLGYGDQSYIGSGGTGYYAVNSIFSPNIKYNVETSIATSNAYLIINGATTSWAHIGTNGEYYNGNIWLFKMNVPGGSEPAQSFKAYDIKLYNDSTLVQNLIPARRNSDLVIGMYDTISNTFFTNSGTGTFIAGNPVNTEICVKKNYYANRVLPSGYTELEYIQMPTTGYINTNISANPAYTNAKMRVCMTNVTGTTGLFGARGSTSTSTKSYNVFGVVNGGSGRFDNTNPSQSYAFLVNTWYDIELGHNGLKGTALVNGTLITGAQNMNDEEVGAIYIGSFYNNGTPFALGTPAKWSSVEIYADGTTLSGNFIPAKNSSNVIGMYDTVTNTFFANAGTGDFTAGPAKTSYTIYEIKKSHYFIGG